MIQEEKKILRKQFLAVREAILPEVRSIMDQAIVKRIQNLKVYQTAKTVGIYYPIGSEVSLLALMEDSNKQFCFPAIVSMEETLMEFRLDNQQFITGPFGTKNPKGQPVSPEQIDLIIVPGVAFSKDGVRLGYGKGFYDRYLKTYAHAFIGCAYEVQITERLPSNDYDVLLPIIVTEREDLCIQH